jgi:hypothetical protein
LLQLLAIASGAEHTSTGQRLPRYLPPEAKTWREIPMKSFGIWSVIVMASAVSATAWSADVVERDQQRDVNQQERIEQGLKSGELSTREAGQLEREQARVDKMEARDLKDGSIGAAEQAKLKAAENKASQDIYQQKHDAQLGNPDSKSSERMQADVQRNVNQQQRIQNGIDNGSLTNREVGSLERGQSNVARDEANAAANGRIRAGEQQRVQRAENHQSKRVYR